MAGSGFRTFTAGEFLTADNIMGYLMKQAVISVADTTARDALSAEDGMVCHSRTDDAWYWYNGSAWKLFACKATSYTPAVYRDTTAITTHGTSATQAGYYAVGGGICTVWGSIVFGTGLTIGGTPTYLTLSLPTAVPCVNSTMQISGEIWMKDNSATDFAKADRIQMYPGDTGKVLFAYLSGTYTSGVYNTETAVTYNTPWTWFDSDEINFKLTYPIW
jgi:hypothetical protein